MESRPLSGTLGQEKQGNKAIPKAPVRRPGRERSRGTAACPPAGGAKAPGLAMPPPQARPAGPAPPPSCRIPSRVPPASFPPRPMARRCLQPSGAPPRWRWVATMDAEVQQVGATAVPRRRREGAAGKEGGMGAAGDAGQECGRPGWGGTVGAVSPRPSRGEALAPVTRGPFSAGAAQLLLPGGALPARPGRGGRGAGAAGRGPRTPLLPGLRRAEGR